MSLRRFTSFSTENRDGTKFYCVIRAYVPGVGHWSQYVLTTHIVGMVSEFSLWRVAMSELIISYS